jgi:hypothetical protein
MIPSFVSQWLGGHSGRYRCSFIATIALATATSLPAIAHEAPTGWTYDLECCSDQDCRPERSEVKATPRGWLVTSTGEIIRYDDGRVHESKDGEFHRCLMQRGVNGPGMTRCLYVPRMGL